MYRNTVCILDTVHFVHVHVYDCVCGFPKASMILLQETFSLCVKIPSRSVTF